RLTPTLRRRHAVRLGRGVPAADPGSERRLSSQRSGLHGDRMSPAIPRRRWLITSGLMTVAVIVVAAVTPPAGPRSIREFDPSRTADLELRMWQADYAQERVRLFCLLLTLLRGQDHHSWATSAKQGVSLARAGGARA